jgi:hypothetical protein
MSAQKTISSRHTLSESESAGLVLRLSGTTVVVLAIENSFVTIQSPAKNYGIQYFSDNWTIRS